MSSSSTLPSDGIPEGFWWDELPECITLEAAAYFLEYARWDSFQGFAFDALLRKRENKNSLLNREPLPPVFSQAEKAVNEAVLCRRMDNYLTYVAEILRTICRAKPEMLKSSEKIAISDVLSHRRMDDLVAWIVERKVNDLSYLGLSELSGELDKRWGFALGSDEDLGASVWINEIRNLIVHNRSVVNNNFLSRTRGSGYSLGDKINLSLSQVEWAGRHLSLMVVRLERVLSEKYDLTKPRSKADLARMGGQIVAEWGGPFGGYPEIPEEWKGGKARLAASGSA
jgi:hypothetical protein